MPGKSLIGFSSVKSEYHCATLLGNWAEERQGFGAGKAGEGGEVDTTYQASYRPIHETAAAEARSLGCFCAEAPRELLFHHGDVAAPAVYLCGMTERSYRDPKEPPLTQAEVLDEPGLSTRMARTMALRDSRGLGDGWGGTLSGGKGQQTAPGPSQLLREQSRIRALLDSKGDHSALAECDAEEGPSENQRPPMTREWDSVLAESVGDRAEEAYTPPVLMPFGRVLDRERLLTTKQTTIDATAEHVKRHPLCHPLTSSKCVNGFMSWANNPMHKTGLRQEELCDSDAIKKRG